MIKKHIPNFITCLNLFSGCIAVYFAFNGNYSAAFAAVLLSAVFDFLDGFAARWLKAYSAMGKELDSLADVLSFGMAPGAIVFSYLLSTDSTGWLPFTGFLIPVFSGLRLAKFNVDTRQADSFIGLPVPANAIFWGGLVYSLTRAGSAHAACIGNNAWVLLPLIALFCFFLVSEIPMFSLKFKNLKWADNKVQFIFLLVCLAILVLAGFNAFPLLISWYIILSVSLTLLKKSKPAGTSL